jgi:selenophosphate synthase
MGSGPGSGADGRFLHAHDDPYTYGQIAAASAVSDIYAVGGRPLTALAIAAFPGEGLARDTIRAIRSAPIAVDGYETPLDQQPTADYNEVGLAGRASKWPSR